jgi:hypothetical protein
MLVPVGAQQMRLLRFVVGTSVENIPIQAEKPNAIPLGGMRSANFWPLYSDVVANISPESAIAPLYQHH